MITLMQKNEDDQPVSATLQELLPKMQEEAVNPKAGVVLPWYPKLTNLLGGLRPHELTLLCAPTGSGKSELLANIAAQLITIGQNVFCAPVEIGDTNFGLRVLGCLTEENLASGEPVPLSKFQNVAKRVLNYPGLGTLFITSYQDRVKRDLLEEKINIHVLEEKCSVVLLDNLNFFLEVTSSQLEKKEMDDTIHQFVIQCKTIPAHIILVVHPRKTENGRVESEFDIKGSSTAVQEAANVILYNRMKHDDPRFDPLVRELVFKKIRKRGTNVNKVVLYKMKNNRLGEI